MLKVIVVIILVIISIPLMFLLLNWIGPFLNRRTQVIQAIEEFVNGTSKNYDWEDFLNQPIADPFLDGIRTKCNDISDRYPSGSRNKFCSEEGLQKLREIALQLKQEQVGDSARLTSGSGDGLRVR
jgi:hypothetical protein